MSYCSACGFQNDDTAKFCKKCGASLGGATAASSSASSSAAPVQPTQPAVPSVVNISGGIVSWPSTFIVQSYIEKVTTHVPLPPFPKLAILLLLAAIVCLFTPLSYTVMPLGFVLLIVGIAWIAFWAYKRATAPKGITIYLNSGAKTTIYVSDHGEANAIVDAIRDSITGEKIAATINFTSAKEAKQEAADLLRGLTQ